MLNAPSLLDCSVTTPPVTAVGVTAAVEVALDGVDWADEGTSGLGAGASAGSVTGPVVGAAGDSVIVRAAVVVDSSRPAAIDDAGAPVVVVSAGDSVCASAAVVAVVSLNSVVSVGVPALSCTKSSTTRSTDSANE